MASPEDRLDTALLATIFSYLQWNEVLNARVCQKWRAAAREAPVTEIFVRKCSVALHLERISRALPNIQAFRMDGLEKFTIAAGENSDPSLFGASFYGVDLSPIANFKGLGNLTLQRTSLKGSFPYLFQFDNLLVLDLLWQRYLKWDLAMVAGLPHLMKLRGTENNSLTGNLSSLRLLKKSLVELSLHRCQKVTGSLDELYDFPVLETIDIDGTQVTGDILTIGETDLPSLKKLDVGGGVYGGRDIAKIEDAPAVMLACYRLKKRSPKLFSRRKWRLDDNSPERYTIRGHRSRAPPFLVEFVKAGNRLGWRWTNCISGGSCEARWFDPEPSASSEGYEKYPQDLQNIERDVGFYSGCTEPPNPEEYLELDAARPLDQMLARFSSPQCWGTW